MIPFFCVFFKKALLKEMILNMKTKMRMNFPTSESVPVRPLYNQKMCHLLFRPLYSHKICHLLFRPQIPVYQLLQPKLLQPKLLQPKLLQPNLILYILRIAWMLLHQLFLIFWTCQWNVMWPLYSLRPLYSLLSHRLTLKTL